MLAAVAAAAAIAIAAGGLLTWRLMQRAPGTGSPLDSGRSRVCSAAVSPCTRPGALRWSIALPGSYPLSLPFQDGMAASRSGDGPVAAFGPGLLVYQRGGMVMGIDPDTGKMRWSVQLGAAGERLFGASMSPLISGNEVAVVAGAGPPAVPFMGEHRQIWILDAATGATDATIPVPTSGEFALLSVSGTGVVVYFSGELQHLDASGATTWAVPLQPFSGLAVAGAMLYADNDGSGRSDTATELQRVDLRTGDHLPDLPLDPSLAGSDGSLEDSGQGLAGVGLHPEFLGEWQGSAPAGGTEPPVLLFEDGQRVAGLDPATGRIRWSRSVNVPIVQTDLGAAPPSAVFYPAGKNSSALEPRMTAVDLATGRTEWTSRRYRADRLEGIYDATAIVTAPVRQSGPGGSPVTRVEGLAPASGRREWAGPWMSAYHVVLGGPVVGPRTMVTLTCAPSGVKLGQHGGPVSQGVCTKARLYAITT